MSKPTKPSLTVEELMERILKVKQSNPGMTATQVMAEIRKTATFSKDKWNAAKKEVVWATVKPTKPTKATKIITPPKKDSQPTPEVACCEICCCTETDGYSLQDEDEFFDAIDALQDDAEDFVCTLFANLKKKEPNAFVSIDACAKADPTLFAVLDKAVEAGLLKEIHGYALGDAYRAKKTVKEKKTIKTPKSAKN